MIDGGARGGPMCDWWRGAKLARREWSHKGLFELGWTRRSSIGCRHAESFGVLLPAGPQPACETSSRIACPGDS
eukprot:3188279-Lingulodinium_polyedra.AAC.1